HADGGLLEEIHFARVYPQHLERLRARYGLRAAVMDYPSYSGARVEDVLGPDADAALASPDWALVYWDDVALVYLPRRGSHAATIERDEYRLVKPANRAAARRFEAEQAIAAAFWRKKDLAGATAAFDRALAIEAAAPVLYNAGLVRAQAGDDRGAIRYWRRAQRADPGLAPVYPALLEAYRRLGDEAGVADLGPAFLAAA